MINAITTKLEVDIMQINELDQAMQLAAIHKLPAVVVHQQLVTQAIATRVRRNGRFKIITTIDWPKGEIFGMNKLRGLTRDMMEIDGYEILLTGGKLEIENRNEAETITNFIHKTVSPLLEIRFVLGCHIRPESEIINMARIMKDIPAPVLIRTDTHLKMQTTKASVKTHTALVKAIRDVCAIPLKLSGNIDSIQVIAGCLQADKSNKFAVNLQQLQQIIKDLQDRPEELQQLLAVSSS